MADLGVRTVLLMYYRRQKSGDIAWILYTSDWSHMPEIEDVAFLYVVARAADCAIFRTPDGVIRLRLNSAAEFAVAMWRFTSFVRGCCCAVIELKSRTQRGILAI